MTKEGGYPDYIGSTRAELDHRLANNYVLLKMALDGVWKPDNVSTLAAESREGFIAGLQRAVKEQFPVFGGVTHDQLTTVIEFAETVNWTSGTELQQLFDLCRELRKPIE